MGTLGRQLMVALVAAGAGGVAGFSSGAAEGKRPIVQTIAASQPTRVKLVVFHPSANPEAERPVATHAPSGEGRAEIIRPADPPHTLRTAPVARGPLAVGSGLTPDSTNAWRPDAAVAASKKPSERPRRGPSARFGQSEIVDPWGTKR